MEAGVIALIVLAVFLFIVAASGVRIVPQARAGVVERLGRYARTLDPGLTLIIPFIDRVKPLIDLREQVVTFPPQPVITEDNLVVGIDTVIYFTVTDPKAATYEVANPLQAIEQLTVTTLRNVIGGMTLEETLTSRDQINSQLRARPRRGDRPVGHPRQPRRARSRSSRRAPSRRRWRSRCAPSATAARRSSPPRASSSPRSSRRRARSSRRCSRPRARAPRRSCAPRASRRRSRPSSRPSTTARPTRAALVPVPADAAPARAGRGEQDLRDPVGVHPGAGRPRRRADGLAGGGPRSRGRTGRTRAPTRRRTPRPPTRGPRPTRPARPSARHPRRRPRRGSAAAPRRAARPRATSPPPPPDGRRRPRRRARPSPSAGSGRAPRDRCRPTRRSRGPARRCARRT